MSHSILITQCLQNDFVRPIGRYDPLPNQLHIGYEEALRLLGEDPDEGPVALTMRWAYTQPADELAIIHIRDWHDPDDPFQHDHLNQFGSHCVRGTEGAQFAFPAIEGDRPVALVESPGLNDFVGTTLAQLLDPLASVGTKVGLIGVWTEAKISFLAYDLRTRYPDMELAVCSVLTASSSRARHYLALEQLGRLLGVQVFTSVGEFTRFLGGEHVRVPLPVPRHTDLPSIHVEDDDGFSDTDRSLVRHLFRECREVKLQALTGGYSGNLVLSSESVDLHGIEQVPHVVKIGPEGPIGQERTAFEQVENALGNSAPRITEFADLDGRGALKYRYAAMGGGFTQTFQQLYCGGAPPEKIEEYLRTVFQMQLGRFYRAASLELVNLLEYYWIDPDYAPRMRAKVEKVLGTEARDDVLTLPSGDSFPNPLRFYEHDLPGLFDRATRSTYFSFVHGDLNGANVIVDDHDNVWLIDFYHTHRGHVLRDMIKLENDLLYIYTPVNSTADLAEAARLTDCLLQVQDLRAPLPDVAATGLTQPAMQRTYETIRLLRSFYPPLVNEDRNPLQLLIGQMRYAGHTLSFFESNDWQKLWALYSLGNVGRALTKRLKGRGALRIDWLDRQFTGSGRLGLTILPGRKDYGRSLPEDLKAMKEQGVTDVLVLLTDNEFAHYGVDGLLEAYSDEGLATRREPILDQGTPSMAEMRELDTWLAGRLGDGANVLMHCVGGLGRAGLVGACYLTSKGLDADAAIDEVRRTRSPRAVESASQEAFVRRFAEAGA